MHIVGRTWLNLVTWTCGSWSEGQHDLYFTVQWFCLISWRLFDVCSPYFGSMNQYDPTFDLKINVCHYDLVTVPWSSDFALYLEDYLMYEHYYMGLWVGITRRLTSKLMYVTETYIPGSSDFALYLFVVWTLLFGIMSQYDPKFDLKINIGHCDLYFMVQWFCITCWRPFEIWI